MSFQVYERECDQCLFSAARIVSPRRMKDVLATTRRKDTFFVCHKASIEGETAACRGWYDRFSCDLSRIAERLGAVEFVPLPPTSTTTTATAVVSEKNAR